MENCANLDGCSVPNYLLRRTNWARMAPAQWSELGGEKPARATREMELRQETWLAGLGFIYVLRIDDGRGRGRGRKLQGKLGAAILLEAEPTFGMKKKRGRAV
jgi:hypothetical protein